MAIKVDGDRPPRSRPARIVTVCVAGRPVAQERHNENRVELVSAVVHHIRKRPNWDPIDAVLFPAGYFRLASWFGPRSSTEREELLCSSEPLQVCRAAAAKLSRRSPGCQVVVGVDTNKPSWGWRGDQLVVAYDADGPVAVARKIFPVGADTDCDGRAPYLLFEQDADNSGRIVRLANGDNAVLSACYDAFVFCELAVGPTQKRNAMRYLGVGDDNYHELVEGEADLLLKRLRRQVRRARPTVSLAAIHSFRAPGAERNWQRHGLATACAALGGALSVGASHFSEALPSSFEHSPLASCGVPPGQLRLGCHRGAHTAEPIDGFELSLPWATSVRGLVRLFQAA